MHPTPSPGSRSLRRQKALALSLALALVAGCAPAAPIGPAGDPSVKAQGGLGVNAKPGNVKRTRAPKDEGGPSTGVAGAIRNAGAAGANGEAGKYALLIYIIGSDLEDDANPRNDKPDEEDTPGELPKSGAATSDLNEIVTAYKALSDAEKANFDCFVAFGGARQTGWKGVKYADLATLVADSEDGYYGNGTGYAFQDDGADMGSEAVFKAFLDAAKPKVADAAKVHLDMWDHGASYGGLGPDTITGKVLSLKEMKAALDAADFKGDVIGFDACLMASVEVAAFVKDRFKYLIASEDLEPGHGQDYGPIVEFVGKNPQASLAEVGEKWVDTFIDSPLHKATDGKTQSVINLEKVGDLLSAVERLGTAYNGRIAQVYQGVLDATGKAQVYGKGGKGREEVCVDLQEFCEHLAKDKEVAVPEVDAVVAAIKGCVLYSRQDGTRPGSKGITAYSLHNLTAFKQGGFNADNAGSATWFKFVSDFMGRGANDGAKPEVTAETASASGFTATIKDDTGVEKVEAVHAVVDPAKPTELVVAQAAPEQENPDVPGEFTLPKWDGMGLMVGNEAGGKIVVPLEEAEQADGFTLYTADGQWNGDDAVVTLVLDASHNVVNTWVSTYEVRADGSVLLDRAQHEILDGDEIAFYRQIYDMEADDTRYELGEAITVAGDVTFSWEKLPGNGVYFTTAEDLNGNEQAGELHTAE